MDIILTRLSDGTYDVNIEHKLVRHSPCGFSWGYLGSGCADLALNILLLYMPERDANNLYQEFKKEVIAHIPERGGKLKDQMIRDWIQTKTRQLREEDM